jgi:tRNA-specific 2-thiouridylase
MSNRRKKVVVAMSGGVDSSVAAGLLIEQGYDVQGVSLRLWEGHGLGPRNCSDHRGAAQIAAMLGIEHTLLDRRSQFADAVVKPFARDYLRGRTPNPCVACNRDFKLGTLLNWAKAQGADYVATGHYARLIREEPNGRVALFRALDSKKDQSYFLFALSRDQLEHTLFPLGKMRKSEVREQARRLDLPVADRPESQDICFGDYRALVASYASSSEVSGGDVVDRSGKVLGQHAGIYGFTIGQRRGLGISSSRPLFVVDFETDSKRVVVGTKQELGCKGLIANNVNWIQKPDKGEIAAQVQIRYRSPAIPCIVRKTGSEALEIRFTEDSPSVTPGQAAVLYRGDRLLGGGWITQALR